MINLDLTLTWDFFVIVFFGVIIAYSFIVGINHCVKIIFSTYISVIAVHGIASYVQKATDSSQELFSVLGLKFDDTILTTVTLFLFVTFIILVAAKGGLEVGFLYHNRPSLRILLTVLFGFSTAGLLLSTLLVILSGKTIFESNFGPNTFQSIVQQSRFIALIVEHQRFWFAMPAFLVVASSLVGRQHLSHHHE